ncbi:MAG: hypothetical protein LR011_09370 [Verrucomicrobia bacterium]|nr:hypothetical protein [Verrucomicrobiota bacterium]
MQPIPSSSDRLMREAHRRRLATGSAFFLAMGVMGQVFVPLTAQTGLDAEAAYELEIVSRDPGSELMFDIETGEAIATNGVRVVYGPSRMDADEVRLNQQTGWVLRKATCFSRMERTSGLATQFPIISRIKPLRQRISARVNLPRMFMGRHWRESPGREQVEG